MIDIDKLEAMEKLAVSAPWEVDEVCRTVIAPFMYEGTGMVGSIVELDDMRFIAAMRNALPELLAEVRRLRKAEALLDNIWAGLQKLSRPAKLNKQGRYSKFDPNF
jgi:hypothetical protein